MSLDKKTRTILRASCRRVGNDIIEIRSCAYAIFRMTAMLIVGSYYCHFFIFNTYPIHAIRHSFIRDYENIRNMIFPDRYIKKQYIEYRKEEDKILASGKIPFDNMYEKEYTDWYKEAHSSTFTDGYGTIFFYSLCLILLLMPVGKPVRIDRKRGLVYVRYYGEFYIEQENNPDELYLLLARRHCFSRHCIFGISRATPWFISLNHYDCYGYGTRSYKSIPVGVWPVLDNNIQGEILYKAIDDFLHNNDDSEYLTCLDNKFHPPLFFRWLYTRTIFMGCENYSKDYEAKLSEQLQGKAKYEEKHPNETYEDKMVEVIQDSQSNYATFR